MFAYTQSFANGFDMQKRYNTDLTNQQWVIIEPLIPPAKDGGRPRTTDMREVVNTCRYICLSVGLNSK